jgi:hypothetical protein
VSRPGPQEPVALTVVRGTPTSHELVALVVLLAAAGGAGDEPAPPSSTWAASGRARRGLAAGVGGWRASGLPR